VTDVIQFFIVIIAVAIVSILGLQAIGGLSTWLENSATGFWNLIPNDEFTLSYAVAIGILCFITANGYWALIQRYTTTATPAEARKVPLLAAAASLVVQPLIYLPAMMSPLLINDKIQALVANGLPLKIAAERAYVLVCVHLLPAGMMGLIVVAIFSATLSALSSEYNILSAVCTKDLYLGLFKRGQKVGEKKQVWIGRLATIVIAMLCTLIGSQVDKLGGAFKFMVAVAALASGPIYLPPLIGLFFRRTPAWGANLSVLTGLAAGIVVKFGLEWSLIGLVLTNTLVTVGTCLLTGLLAPIRGERKAVVDQLFNRLSGQHESQETVTITNAPTTQKHPFAINLLIGGACAVFALFLFTAAVMAKENNGFFPNILAGIGLGNIGAVLITSHFKKKAKV
jgi:SSS family solute:Na+ symporter